MKFTTETLAQLIERVIPDYAHMTLPELVDCVRHHVGGIPEIEVETALEYLDE